MGPNGVHKPEDRCGLSGLMSRRERRGVSRPHLQLGLIGSSAKFGRCHSVDQASAEEPFVALLHVIGVGLGDGV
jgi:hypothetical protein